jgi:hypothetical protein
VLDNSTLEDSERLLRSFYRTIEPYKKRNWKNPRRISWEIFAEKDKIGFYVVCPREMERLIKSRIKDAYQSSEVRTISDDYVNKFTKPFTTEVNLSKHHMFSTKLNSGDVPLNSVLNAMSGLEEDERMLLQVTMLPINNTWQGRAYARYREMLFNGKKPTKPRGLGFKSGILYSLQGLMHIIEFFYPLGMSDEQKNTPIEREELKGTQKKISLPAFNTSIRMLSESKDKNSASTRLSEMANSFIELDGDNEWRRVKTSDARILKFVRERKVYTVKNNIVTTQELAPLVRLANKNINIPELKKALKTQPIPQGLDKGIFFAYGMYNSEEVKTFMNPVNVEDFVHPTIYTGGMGGGKTTEIMNQMLGRALAGYSVILLDTQGDMTVDFLSQLPEELHDRVVWLNFGDLNYPVPLDLMEFVSLGNQSNASRIDEMFVKDIAKNELISIFKKMYGANFGPQTEYITRNNITATIETGGTMMEMFRMLVDDEFRTEVTMNIRSKAPFAYSFWANFQQNFTLSQKMRMVMPSINKIGAFVESPIIRNIMCQGTQNYNFREMMDSGKIVVVTIPKGILVGTWQLVASLVLSKIWLASLSRVSTPTSQRIPCFLASDEADDIINDQFPIMLSQSRKFRLGINLGFQYLDQIKDNNRKVFNALIGNSPNICAMKIGEKDLDIYHELFKDYYKKDELRGFPNLHGVARLSINGEPTSPFTIRIPANYTTLDNTWREVNEEVIDRLQAKSRKLYARTLAEVEEIVDKRYEEVLSAFTLGEDVEDVDHEAQIDEDDLRSLIG